MGGGESLWVESIEEAVEDALAVADSRKQRAAGLCHNFHKSKWKIRRRFE